jgi:hypothetical protein
LFHAALPIDLVVDSNLVNTDNLAENSRSGGWVGKSNNALESIYHPINHTFNKRVHVTYNPWKKALERYSKYAGAQSRNIWSSVLEIHLITKRSSDVLAKLAPLFPPLASHEYALDKLSTKLSSASRLDGVDPFSDRKTRRTAWNWVAQ